jgi:hypothetical protein
MFESPVSTLREASYKAEMKNERAVLTAYNFPELDEIAR